MQAFKVELAGKKGAAFFCSTDCALSHRFTVVDGEFASQIDYPATQACENCGVFLNDAIRAANLRTLVVVKLLNPERVLDGKVGQTFIVDKFTPSSQPSKNTRGVAHVRDYRRGDLFGGIRRPYQIWSLGPNDYEIVFEKGGAQ